MNVETLTKEVTWWFCLAVAFGVLTIWKTGEWVAVVLWFVVWLVLSVWSFYKAMNAPEPKPSPTPPAGSTAVHHVFFNQVGSQVQVIKNGTKVFEGTIDDMPNELSKMFFFCRKMEREKNKKRGEK